MPHLVTLIPGDGIGPELVAAACRVLTETGVAIEWDVQQAGADCVAAEGTPLPPRVLESLRRTRVGLKGPISTPIGTGFRSVNVALRKELDLYVNLRPARTYAGVPRMAHDVNLVIVRENTEDLYAGLEFAKDSEGVREVSALVARLLGRTFPDDAGLSLKPISVTGSRRIARFAFEYARANGRRKVTAAHKANIMKDTDGLFLSVTREVAAGYPDIEFQDVIVDNLCMQLVQRPQQYDVLLLPNLYGDIVSDLCAGLVGGLGVAPGANLGDGIAMFEPVHGSAPQFKGSGLMNPTALLLSCVMMLQYLGEREAARRLESAITKVLAEGRVVTRDLRVAAEADRAATTEQMADAIIDALRTGARRAH
ncbi:MAG: isocitrate/isopropylmalate dehydrogenase family protein [Candidatus Eisenbacteria bacterium]|uniref:Isocitrate/isopropylmalate dehydrogenase family protein n=1 Tax=Eiseniibacteriota bacterium TaxID=2212470 RepID=A0A849SQ56_UNCEI|nr:isocitrate/isopropylmalate dehydrogenase family protein [Candidatus Eisenbacteria bacterium]